MLCFHYPYIHYRYFSSIFFDQVYLFLTRILLDFVFEVLRYADVVLQNTVFRIGAAFYQSLCGIRSTLYGVQTCRVITGSLMRLY